MNVIVKKYINWFKKRKCESEVIYLYLTSKKIFRIKIAKGRNQAMESNTIIGLQIIY